MKRTLILFICTILLPLTAHTQKQLSDSSNWSKLDSLRTERRLVVLAVTSLEYHKQMNANLCLENQTLKTINLHNESYIGQLQRELRDIRNINEGLTEELNEGLRLKKKWRNATLLIGGIFISTLLLAQL